MHLEGMMATCLAFARWIMVAKRGGSVQNIHATIAEDASSNHQFSGGLAA